MPYAATKTQHRQINKQILKKNDLAGDDTHLEIHTHANRWTEASQAQTPTPTTSRQGLGREAQSALLRIRTGPECPEGKLSELTWASKPDCGIATAQKALT